MVLLVSNTCLTRTTCYWKSAATSHQPFPTTGSLPAGLLRASLHLGLPPPQADPSVLASLPEASGRSCSKYPDASIMAATSEVLQWGTSEELPGKRSELGASGKPVIGQKMRLLGGRAPQTVLETAPSCFLLTYQVFLEQSLRLARGCGGASPPT